MDATKTTERAKLLGDLVDAGVAPDLVDQVGKALKHCPVAGCAFCWHQGAR